MAAKGLKKEAAKAGDEIKVETQSASGMENEVSTEEIATADIVILAIDTAIQGMDRFHAKKVLQVGTSQVLKNAKGVLREARNMVEGE